ncbi:MAG TPA: AbrB/MazE/SpoVT family DNA-binding domain-containing protein [Pararhizobium sp.]|nr:AbrB/MazE/SpoVT family DNA-binding domain-containing protein [Pararhizobium sp.]
MNTVIRKIGNSEGVILPKEVLERMNLHAGDAVMLTEGADGLRLTRINDADEHKRRMAIARERMEKYKVALRELAK